MPAHPLGEVEFLWFPDRRINSHLHVPINFTNYSWLSWCPKHSDILSLMESLNQRTLLVSCCFAGEARSMTLPSSTCIHGSAATSNGEVKRKTWEPGRRHSQVIHGFWGLKIQGCSDIFQMTKPTIITGISDYGHVQFKWYNRIHVQSFIPTIKWVFEK